MKITVIVGTRPEIIKMQPVIKEIQKRKHDHIFIHTGQHYDFMMSNIFVNGPRLLKPDYFLKVKSTSQGIQTGKIIAACERILKAEKPDIILVQGDTNSALGAALASSKLGLPVGHVEAGCRSFDKLMSEEINRVLISDIASLHFAPTSSCVENLRREGVPNSQIFLTGHPIVDVISQIRSKIMHNNLEGLRIHNKNFALVTVHRRENIELKEKLSDIVFTLNHLAERIPVIFPCHPHTLIQINRFSLKKHLKNVEIITPVSHIDSLSLIRQAKFVLTDSGGIQQEAAILGTPCITLRDVTEWVETVKSGVNFLAGPTSKGIIRSIQHLERNYDNIIKKLNSTKNLFGKVGSSRRIMQTIEKKLF